MASTAESKYGALLINGQASVPIPTTLTEMGHPQPPTPIQVDNDTSVGISNKSIRQKMTKYMDMNFIGSKTGSSRGTSISFVNQTQPTYQIINPSINQRLTTFNSGVLTYMNHLFHTPHCKGVLNPQTVKLPVHFPTHRSGGEVTG